MENSFVLVGMVNGVVLVECFKISIEDYLH